MKKEKRYLQDGESFYSSFFGEEPCPSTDVELSKEELDEAICECESMLQYAVDKSDREETSFWRKMLQRAKVHRRELLNT